MPNKRPLACALALALALPAAFAQGNNAALNKPLSERSLLNVAEPSGSEAARRPPLSVGESDGKPGDDKKGSDKSPRKGPTEITSDALSFDQRSRQAVFLGHVKVTDPEVNIECDKLTAIFKGEKVGNKADTSAARAPTPPNAAPAPAKNKGSGLEKAIAEGKAIIVQEKAEPDGKVNRSIGRAKRAEFESSTGNVTLTGMPSIQQGINTVVATEEGTVLILNREGTMTAKGPTKSVIQDSATLDNKP